MIAATQTENQLRKLAHVPWHHRRLVMRCFFGVVVLAALANWIMPRTYRSEGELLLRLGRENMSLDPTATVASTPILTVQQSRENEINSVIEILRSHSLLEKVATSIGPDEVLERVAWNPTLVPLTDSSKLPSAANTDSSSSSADSAAHDAPPADPSLEDAVRRLSKSLNAEAVRKSNVVAITYDAHNPALAQTIVDRLITYFLEDYIRLNRTPGAQEFLSQQTNTIRQQLHAKETELRNLQDSTELAEPEGQRTIVVNRIGHLEDDLLQTSAQLASSSAEVKQLRDQLKSLPATQVTEQTVGFADDASSGMRQQLYALQMREQDLASRFTDVHPQLKEVRQQIADAQSVLKQEPQRTQTKTGPSKPYEEIKVQLLKDEPILAALEAKTDHLKTELADEKQKLQKLNADELRITQLQREVRLEEANYHKYSDSLEQARIDRVMAEEGKSNVSIVQPATLDLKPTKPNILLNMMLAAVVGLLGGLGLAFAVDAWNMAPHIADNGHSLRPEAVLTR
jgi:polysaccharide biosynthesis protein PslE